MKNIFQVVYPASESNENEIIERFRIDAEAMRAIGICVGAKHSTAATHLMYRGFIIFDEIKYPNDKRFLNTYEIYKNYQYLSKYH